MCEIVMKIALIATGLLALIQGLESNTMSICLGGQKCLHLCWVEAFLDKLTISSMKIKHVPKVFGGGLFLKLRVYIKRWVQCVH